MQKWIQPTACSDHDLHGILSSYWLAHFYLMKKSAKKKCCSILVWIANDGIFYLRAAIQRKNNWYLSCIFGARFGKKDRGLGTCKQWSEQAGGLEAFCMKRLRTLKLFHLFITEIKKSKTYNGWCPFQGLSYGTTLMQIQSGRAVPLTHAVAGFNSDKMTYEFRLWYSQCGLWSATCKAICVRGLWRLIIQEGENFFRKMDSRQK